MEGLETGVSNKNFMPARMVGDMSESGWGTHSVFQLSIRPIHEFEQGEIQIPQAARQVP